MKNKNSKIMKLIKKEGINFIMGKRTSLNYLNDPIRLTFTLSRYKFVAKMLEGCKNVLEIGAGDGFKSKIVAQFVKKLTLSDIEIENIKEYKKFKFNKLQYVLNNFGEKNIKNKIYDGIYALDVLEHIKKKEENKFMMNMLKNLSTHGTVIIGMPSVESQKYASKLSKIGHVNCKNKKELKLFLSKFFNNIYMFSMNDETLHTGFDKMSHYIFAVCNSKRDKS